MECGNNCRVLFRLAEASGLLQAPLPPRLLKAPPRRAFRRDQRATAPYKNTYSRTQSRRYALPQAEWPPDIAQGFSEYQARCGLRLRASTLTTYVRSLGTYLGYIAHVGGRTPTWNDLFDVAQVRAFVRWHAARLKRPLTIHGRHVATIITTIARVLEHSQAPALAALCTELKAPAPLHTKRAHWVSLAQLEEVAEACLAEGRAPYVVLPQTRHPGARRASAFQRGLMLKLLVRVPLRQRNVREMRLGEHLFKDQDGYWQLYFSGTDLKISHRGAAVNKYELNLSTYAPEWIALLDEFLRVHRPRLPNPTGSTLLFLTHRGRPFDVQSLREELSLAVAMRTGQRFYPHLIRTIWATAYLEKTQDFTTAAVMLGDTPATVMKAYYDVVNKDHHTKAKAFLGTELHTG